MMLDRAAILYHNQTHCGMPHSGSGCECVLNPMTGEQQVLYYQW